MVQVIAALLPPPKSVTEGNNRAVSDLTLEKLILKESTSGTF
ncbi:hypothetical protein [Lichenihabitans psoromatis]|nr:hypothetical protein [Lichenihabitans psoromatis]